MNAFKRYKENGISVEGSRQMNVIRGCIMGSHLESQDKKELLQFMGDLEEYLEDEDLG